MSTNPNTRTQSLDHCRHCQAVIYDRDQYCRHCGVLLGARTALLSGACAISERPTSELSLPAAAYVTAPLTRLETRRPVSGSLLTLVAEETTPACDHRWHKRLTLALIALPIWLMIVLLSPLDAYAATKAVGARM